jgi:hypothetical protein
MAVPVYRVEVGGGYTVTQVPTYPTTYVAPLVYAPQFLDILIFMLLLLPLFILPIFMFKFIASAIAGE